MKSLAEKIAVMQAALDGRRIEKRVWGYKDWDEWDGAIWNWHYCDYRIVPEPPQKKWRPFASAAEFKPHRDRWWKYKDHDEIYPPQFYDDRGHGSSEWKVRFDTCVFEDGSPFGVEVTE